MNQFLTMLLIAAAGFATIFLSSAVSEWKRRRQFVYFADLHGCTYSQQDISEEAPFFENLSSWHLLRGFEIKEVNNILCGKIEGIDVVYFEQSYSAAFGSIAPSGGAGYGSTKLSSYAQSIAAVEIAERAHFEFQSDDHKNMQVRRIGNWVYFSPGNKYVIPVKKLESFWLKYPA